MIRRFNEAEAFTPRIRRLRGRVRPGRPGASMRPRLLHLGYQRANPRSAGGSARFNEAEAFTPRIQLERAHGELVTFGFNEAEAFTPRIPGAD